MEKGTSNSATLIDIGSAAVIIALLVLVYGVWGARKPRWLVTLFYLIVVVVVVSAPIGMVLGR